MRYKPAHNNASSTTLAWQREIHPTNIEINNVEVLETEINGLSASDLASSLHVVDMKCLGHRTFVVTMSLGI
jgi:hypothetical protein